MVQRFKYYRLFVILFTGITSSYILLAQETGVTDSIAADSLNLSFMADSTQLDSLTQDSLQAKKKSKGELEGPIKYTADVVSMSRIENKIFLEGNAKVVYLNITLEAEKIMIDQNDHILYAEGVVDSVDTLGNPIYRGTPVFQEKGDEPIKGSTLSYNFHTKRGKIIYGKTKMPPGYYKGEYIHKISNKTLLIEDGYFTSCEYIDEPHFYFRSDKMRVEVGEKVVAKPVYLYIADVPIAVIPFGVFPNKKGRHSGILIPTYGESAYGGRFLKNMGYYWAPNDYLDATLTTDFYDKLGFTYKASLDYVVRYILNGRISGFYFPKDPNRSEIRNRWAVQFNHTHQIDPTLRIAASGKFQSDGELAKDYASDYNRRVDQVLSSNLTLSKRWTGTKNSLQFSLSRTENLQAKSVSWTVPSLRFSRSQTSIYETFSGQSVRGKKNWYQQINFSYNGRLINKGSKANETADTDERKGIEHNLTFNSPQKILRYLNISPSINYKEIWVDELTEAIFDPDSNRIVEQNRVKQFAVRRTYNGSISMNTTMFGMFEPNIGSLKFIRHKIDPRVSFSFSPDFSDPGYGYFTYFQDSTGKEILHDKFKYSAFGGTPSRSESQSMNMSLSNLFQAKLVNEDKETKVDLFRLNFSTRYNFLADSLNWSTLSSNFSATPLKGVNLRISSSHSFYKPKTDGSGNRNEFTFPRLLNLNANLGFSIDQNTFVSKGKDEDEEAIEEEIETEDEGLGSEFQYVEETSDEFAAKRINIPWRLNFSVNYTQNRSNAYQKNEKLNIKATANISVTKNWRINWTSTYDAIEKELVYQSISIYRDLHCWEMSFNWQPSIDYYSFRINVKASILQDLKLTKHPSATSRNVGY